MDANSRNLKTIFGQDRRHVVPLFQRPYVWEQARQWEPLWEDIRHLAEKVLARDVPHPHFMGAIVMEQQAVPLGAIEERLIIDGQQRLTTLQIFLAAVRDVSALLQSAEHRHTQALAKLTRNDDPMIERDEDRFKVWPTNHDRKDFEVVMTLGSLHAVTTHLMDDAGITRPKAEARLRTRKRLILAAYSFFHEQVREWAAMGDDASEQRLGALMEALRQHVNLVVIDLTQQDDAQVIFESLNARGTPLLPADLVKSYLLQQAGRQKANVQKLYDKYWAAFDDPEEPWRDEVLQGRQQRPRIDLFLLHYLTLKTKDEVPASRVYDGFREWLDGQPQPAADVMVDLRSYADVYRRMDTLPPGDPDGRFFNRLGLMDTSTPLPFLMEVFRQFGGAADDLSRRAILGDLESFLVRRLLCRLNTRGYNRLFLDMLAALSTTAPQTAGSARAFLLAGSAENNRWPSDDEFESAWMSMPVYRTLAKRRVRMLLEAIEAALYTRFTEKISIETRLNVEHLMPRKWRNHWPLPDGAREGADQERDTLLDTIGNLTLLTGPLNKSISDGPWDRKRPALKKHTGLRLNAGLLDHEHWDEVCIRARSRELFALAVKIWPRPDGA